jgi:hypothetical protein
MSATHRHHLLDLLFTHTDILYSSSYGHATRVTGISRENRDLDTVVADLMTCTIITSKKHDMYGPGLWAYLLLVSIQLF